MFGVCLGKLGVLTHAGWATLNHWVTESEYLVLQLPHLCIGQFENMVHRICQENWTYVSPIEVACILKKLPVASSILHFLTNKKKGRNRIRLTFLHNHRWPLRSPYTAVDLFLPFSGVPELLQLYWLYRPNIIYSLIVHWEIHHSWVSPGAWGFKLAHVPQEAMLTRQNRPSNQTDLGYFCP